jgi:hypothetical protein
MLTPSVVGQLRRAGVWQVGQRLHSALVPLLCVIIHTTVQLLGRFAPQELRLKHIYDYQVVWVDPARITQSLKVGEWHRREAGGSTTVRARFHKWWLLGGGWKNAARHLTRNLHGQFITDGDWDLRTRPHEMRPVVIELFVEGRLPQQTAEYQKLAAWIDDGRFGWTKGCRTREDLDHYFDALIGTYERIRDDGYLTQCELGSDGSDEIRIAIDRHGDPCVFGGGTHRLAIARVLGIPEVPVLVKRVHATWVAASQERLQTGDAAEAIGAALRRLAANKEEVEADD